MLKPPLSLLSDELLKRIVDEVGGDDDFLEVRWLKRLSVVHRAFTTLCQSRLFSEVRLDGYKSEMISSSKGAYETLKLKQHPPASFVRRIRLDVNRQRNISWLFQDKHFISFVQTLSQAPQPPYHLEIYGYNSSMTQNSELMVAGPASSFFSKSLKTLEIGNVDVPAALLVCPNPKNLSLHNVHTITPKRSTRDYNEVPLDRPLPKLRELDHSFSFDIIQRFLPNKGARQLADLSQLRVLAMCPEDEENMQLAQPILDAAHNTLEEIKLQQSYVVPYSDSDDEQSGYLLLAGLLNFQRLHRLHVFELRSGIHDNDPDRLDVVQDITKVLSTVPKYNWLARIYIRIQVCGKAPYKAARLQKWNAFAKEIARISGGKPLRFELDMDIQSGEYSPTEGPMRALYDHVKQGLKPLGAVDGVNVVFQNELTHNAIDLDSYNELVVVDSNPGSVY